MKKLIAIVISFIFIFEGTGYCLAGNTLRPRLIYNKALSNEIKIDAVNWDLVTDPSQEPLKLVSSYSGIRGIFGEEEWITEETKIIILGFSYTYAKDLIDRWLSVNPDKKRFKLLIGRDTRHTGEAIKDLHIAGFKLAAEDMGVEVEIIDLGVVTTPFIESAIRTLEADGGVIITASHNEPDFNGFKYLTGFEEPEQNSLNKGGGILNPSKKGVIIKETKDLLKNMAGEGKHNLIERANKMFRESGIGPDSNAGSELAKASEGYRMLPRKEFRLTEERVKQIRAFNDSRNNKMVYDSNGGGGYKIIPELLRDFIEVKEINNTPGKFVHKIEPVGDALLDAAKEVERLRAILGLATDCDADRGNLTGMDPQDVALLNAAGMLAWITANIDLYPEAKNKKWAIVAHDATSLRTAEIAEKFGAEVFEVETGEVNVFTKIHDLEQKGYFVPIGVEGYNGGTIFMGTEVRDGALTALISILMLSDKKVFEVLLDKMGIKDQKIENAPSSLQDILNMLPKYYTIQKDLKEEGVTASSEVIKARLEAAFTKRIKEDSKRGIFEIEGLWDKEFKEYKFLNYEETHVLEGMGNRITQTGGFKILLTDTDDKKHFIWFRGSKTELGIFRACVDSPDKNLSQDLSRLQNFLYKEAVEKPNLVGSYASILIRRGVTLQHLRANIYRDRDAVECIGGKNGLTDVPITFSWNEAERFAKGFYSTKTYDAIPVVIEADYDLLKQYGRRLPPASIEDDDNWYVVNGGIPLDVIQTLSIYDKEREIWIKISDQEKIIKIIKGEGNSYSRVDLIDAANAVQNAL